MRKYSEEYTVLKQSFGIMVFICLIKIKAVDIYLLTWEIWYFQLRFSFMKMPKKFTDFWK